MYKENSLREKIWRVIFQTDTPAAKAFDVVLIGSILLSVLAVMLESVQALHIQYGQLFYVIEWIFTILFTIEYLLRIYSVRNAKKYIFSFFGIIDLIAILPTYISFFFVGAQSLLVVRSFRLLRVFRVFKLTHYLTQANILSAALHASRPKITVFLVAVLAMVTTMGAIMYLIEGAASGFTSIPRSIYWAIVTMTTVGFGDITPQTPHGQMLAAVLMILGYGILAVPTGIVSVEIARAGREEETYVASRQCTQCQKTGHSRDAAYCKFCGHGL